LDDWRGLTKETGAPEEEIEARAARLANRAAAAAPAAVQLRLVGSLSDASLEPATRTDVMAFVTANPDLLLGRDGAATFLELPEAERAQRLAGVSDPEATLATFDMLSNTAAVAGLASSPDPDAVAHDTAAEIWRWLAEHHLSAAKLAVTPTDELVTLVVPGTIKLEPFKDRGVKSTTLAVWNRIEHASRTLGAPAAMNVGAPMKPRLGGVVDWATLFGSESACECTHCSSVLGPSAYFIDLLDFVRDFPRPVAASPALSTILAGRRPDILHIPLTCANSNTPLPQIDLVTELLEDLVAPPFVPFALPASAFADVEQRLVSHALRTVLEGSPLQIALAADASIVSVGATTWWILDGGRLCEITGTRAGATWQGMVVSAVRRQTAGTAEQLAAMPAHANLAVSETLAMALHPWPLPFDLAHEEGRAYLAELGLARAGLIDAMSATRHDGSVMTLPRAREILELNPQEARIITSAVGTVEEIWGGPLADLARVPELLRRAGIDFVELTTLLTTRFVNGSGAVGVQGPVANPLTCDVEQMTLVNLNDVVLGRMMRFVRLWRRIGWTMIELDRALVTFAVVELSASTLLDLAAAKVLAARYDLAVEDLLVWFGPIDAHRYADPREPGATLASPHDRMFGTTPRTHASVLAGCGVTAADVDLLIARQAITSFVPADLASVSAVARYASVARALAVDLAGLFELGEVLGVPPLGGTAATLTYTSRLDRLKRSPFTQADAAMLRAPLAIDATIKARLADLERELVTIVSETEPGEDPTGTRLRSVLLSLGWSDAAATTLVDEASGRTRHEVPLVLTATTRWEPPVDLERGASTLATRGVMTTTRRDQLLLAVDDPAVVTGADADAARVAIKAALTALYAAPQLGAYGKLVDTISETPLDWLPAALQVPPRLTERVAYDAAARVLVLVGDLAAAEVAELLLGRVGVTDPTEVARWAAFETALQQLFAPTRPQVPGPSLARWAPLDELRAGRSLLGPAVRLVRARRSREARVRAIAAWSELPIAIVARNAATLEALVPGQISGANLQPTALATAIYSRWLKIGVVARKLALTGAQVAWLWADAASAGYAPLSSLEVGVTFDQLDAWVGFARVRDGVARWAEPIERALPRISAITDVADRLRALAGVTGWSLEAVTAFVPVADYTTTALVIERLARAMRLAHTTRTELAELVAAARADLTPAIVSRLRAALQRRLGDKDWLVTAKRIHDPLREQRRDALVAQVVHHVRPGPVPPTMRTDRFELDTLYEYLLIDTQVTPCVLTSRIRQATASVQLLVERALAAEEAFDSTAALPGWKWRWETWQKRYRVWEANRKLFLYPENWLDPALRDDRTGEFKLLEQELARPDLVPDAALTAYQRYLRDIDQLQHLEVVAFLPEVDPRNREVSQIFARTKAAPRTYYVRRFTRARGPVGALPTV
ncbi:MAG: neuraminidase-like domain-containing protein, partial [Kofleriaceae bacterium]